MPPKMEVVGTNHQEIIMLLVEAVINHPVNSLLKAIADLEINASFRMTFLRRVEEDLAVTKIQVSEVPVDHGKEAKDSGLMLKLSEFTII